MTETTNKETPYKTMIADRILQRIGVTGAFSPAGGKQTEQALAVMEEIAEDLEANGARIGWLEAFFYDRPGMNEDGSEQESHLPRPIITAFMNLACVRLYPEIYPGLPIPPNIERAARSAPQTLIKFDWESCTPQMHIRGGAPIGSGNTKYRYIANRAPNREKLDVENNTNLDNIDLY